MTQLVATNDVKAEAGNDSAVSVSPSDFRAPKAENWALPRAVADGPGGMLIATATIAASPERIFRAVTTSEVEQWWGHEGFYRQENWQADVRVCGQWSVSVRLANLGGNRGSGEFVEVDAPHKLVMTRRFDQHPLQGTRETTITWRLEPAAGGTRITVREEGFVGRSEAAYGNAEHWERVLSWLADWVRGSEPVH